MTHAGDADMLSRHPLAPIPPDTIKAARAILGRSNFYLQVGDNWESLLGATRRTETADGETAQNWMSASLMVVTLLQYKEKVSDRQAEEASRLRVDWKYALHLSMHHPGLSRVMLCQYRRKAYHLPAWQQEFQSLLDRFIAQGLLHECQEPALAAATLLSEVCTHSRLEEVMLILRSALETLAIHHSKWLRDIILPHWYTRYQLFKAAPDLPQGFAQQKALAELIGADILYLVHAVLHSGQPELEDLEEIKTLQQTWVEQFEATQEGGVRRRTRCSYCGVVSAGSEMGG